MPTRSSLFALLASTCLAIGSSALAQSITFTDVTLAAGITRQHQDPGLYMGAGGAFLDYDNDGWQDIYLSGGDQSDALYRNLGNGTFADVTIAAGLAVVPGSHWVMSATAADYDNDGDCDLYLGVLGPNRLYQNQGNGTFLDVTATAQVGDPRWTTGAAFADYDGDGWLDLYVGNYIQTPMFPYHAPWPNALYRNNGNGTFSDVTALCGVAGAGTTLAVSWTDYDRDGDPDLFVGNDFGAWVQPNRLYRNDGPAPGPATPGSWLFTDVSAPLHADPGIYCMGITAGDFDRDLDFDYYFSNLGRNVFLRNDGPPGFVDVTATTGTELTYDPTAPTLFATSWGVGFHDFDHDGWIDLYVSNGHVPSASFLANGLLTPNTLYRHDGPALTYTNVSAAAGIADQQIGRGCAFADYDNDGDVDILQANCDGRPNLFRNDTAGTGRWMKIRPVGRLSTSEAHCGVIRVDVGGVGHLREINRNYSFESSSEQTVHFGLGSATEADKVSVRWPSGVEQNVHHVGTNRSFVALEPVLTVDATSHAPATVTNGSVFSAVLVIRNHRGVTETAFHFLQIRVGGAIWTGPLQAAFVGPQTTAGVNWSLWIPPGTVASGSPVPVEILWTVFDGWAGLDQWKIDVQLQP